MAEGVGIAFAAIGLVLDLYTRCKNASLDIRRLHQDLKCFQQTLSLAEGYLPHLDSNRIACDELVADIEKLLSDHPSRNPLRRIKLSFEDLERLRSRLSFQLSALSTSVNMLRDRGLDPSFSRSPSVAVTETNEFGTDYHGQMRKRPASDLSLAPLNAMAPGSRLSSSSTIHMVSDAVSLLSPTASLESANTARDLSDLQPFLNRRLSISPVQKEQSSPRALYKSWRSRSRTEIVEAIKEDNISTARNIRSDFDKNSVDSILMAVSKTTDMLPVHSELVKVLLQLGASFEWTDPECLRTPLIWAIVAGRKDLVELFLEERAPVETRDGIWDWTPATWAVMENKPAILDVLIQKGADLTATDRIFDRTPLLWAASIGSQPAAKLLLRRERGLIHVADREGMTPLALACFKDHLETARLFVNSGDNCGFEFESGSSLLAWAVLGKNEDFAQLLLENGADARSTDMAGVPVLILAIQQNLPDIAELLVDKGADVQCTDDKGAPALTVAVKERRPDMAAMLIRHAAELEARDCEGNTALLWAIWRADERLVRMLVKGGANPTAVDGEGVTAWTWAAWTGNAEIVQLVSSSG